MDRLKTASEMADGDEMDARRPPAPHPTCVLCSAFRATWHPQYPRECRAYGFRSREYPSAVVLRLSSRPCELFAPRAVAPRRPATR